MFMPNLNFTVRDSESPQAQSVFAPMWDAACEAERDNKADPTINNKRTEYIVFVHQPKYRETGKNTRKKKACGANTGN